MFYRSGSMMNLESEFQTALSNSTLVQSDKVPEFQIFARSPSHDIWLNKTRKNYLLVPCIEIRYNNFCKASYCKKMSQFCHSVLYYSGLNLIKLWPGRFSVHYIVLIGNPHEKWIDELWRLEQLNSILRFWTRPFSNENLQIHAFDTKLYLSDILRGQWGYSV